MLQPPFSIFSPQSRIAVLGAGAFGTALALAFAQAGRLVSLWGRDQETMLALKRDRISTRYLHGTKLSDTITPMEDLNAALCADVIVIALPTQNIRTFFAPIAAFLLEKDRIHVPILCAAKGIEQVSGRFVSDILAEAFARLTSTSQDHRLGILSGPSFAEDIARGLPTALTLALPSQKEAEALALLLSSPTFRLYHSTDRRGVEIGGAAKNVLAIAAGITLGMGLGESARAAMITRGFAELRRFALAFGAQSETLMGLSGLGDLILTASSPQSRNFSLGMRLGKGEDPASALGAGSLAEGAFTAPILARLAKERGVDMPIVTAIAAILAGRFSVSAAIEALLARPLRQE